MIVNEINKLKTVNEVEEIRKQVNEACDKRVNFINACSKADELSKKPFGYMKEAFESISPMLFESAEGKGIINKYTQTIRGSKNLSSLHSLYEAIRKAGKETDVNFFINSIDETFLSLDKKTLEKDNAKLGRVIAEAYLCASKEGKVSLPEEKKELNCAVNFIAENKKTAKNLAEYSDAVKVIRENILKNEIKRTNATAKSLDEIAESLIKEFNKKYSNKLSLEDINLIREVSSASDKEKLFNQYKESCEAKISEAKENFVKNGDNESAKRLSVVLEQISGKSFSKETINEDIFALVNLSKIF